MNGIKARQVAHRIITQWLNSERYLEYIMDFSGDILSHADKRFAESLVHHVIRYCRTLDFVVSSYIRKKPEPRIYAVILMGSCEILLMNVKDHAAIHSSVELAGSILNGTKGFVNAVLRKVLLFRESGWKTFLSDTSINKGLRYSFPDWIISRWEKQFGDELTDLLESLNRTPSKMARIVDTEHRHDVIERLKELNAFDRICSYHPDYVYLKSWQPVLEDDVFSSGRLVAQDASAALPVQMIVSDKPDSVLDVCSAPGGKLSAVRQYLDKEVPVYGYDAVPHRIEHVEALLDRLKLDSVILDVANAENSEYPQASHILVDAPCSGFGVIRKRSDLRWRRKPEEMTALMNLQFSILSNVSRFVQKKGLLVYSTCTFDLDENMGTVKRFLASHPDFKIQPAEEFNIPADFLTNEGAAATLPHRHLCEGSFAIALRKD